MNLRSLCFASAAAAIAAPSLNAALITLPATGWNRDIVVENTAVPAGTSYQAAVNATMDSGTVNTGGTWYQAGLAGSGAGGLPAPGSNQTSAFDANTTFQLQPYTGNNALMLDAGLGLTGTLTLATATPLSSLALIGSTGNGSGTDTVLVNFSDGFASQSFSATQIGQDWFGGGQIAFNAAGRINNVVAGTFDNVGAANPRLYQTTFDLSAVSTHPVSSVTITYGGANGHNAIMAISGQVVPEPSVAAVGGIALLGLVRRRRN